MKIKFNKVHKEAKKPVLTRLGEIAKKYLLVSGLALSLTLGTGEVKADTAKKPEVKVAQNNQQDRCDYKKEHEVIKNGEEPDYRGCNTDQLRQIYNELPEVSLSDMQKFAKETEEKYQIRGIPLFSWFDCDEGFFTGAVYKWESGDMLHALAGICKTEECRKKMKKNKFFQIDATTTVPGGLTNLEKSLEPLYKLVTGKEITYIRIVIDYGKDETGDYVSASAVPVDKIQGELKKGMPIFSFTYYIDLRKTYHTIFVLK